MDYTPTHQQAEARGFLAEQFGNSIAAAQAVRHQPNLTAEQREAVQWAIVAMLKAKRAMAAGSCQRLTTAEAAR